METKKHPKADIRDKRHLFFNIGLSISLLMAIFAFEYESPVTNFDVDWRTAKDIFDEPPIPITTITPPPPPKIINPVFIKVEDDIEPEEFTSIPDNEINTTELIANLTIEEPKTEAVEDTFYIVEQMPKYPGGIKAFYKNFAKNIHYPKRAKKMSIEGRVILSFIIDKDGSLTNIKVVRGIGAGCNEEAIRVLKKMPNWQPGKQRGKPVKVQMSIPITFKLN